jgi:DNA-binding NtrC family response regulator
MRNVLIIESNPALLLLYQEWLSLIGYCVQPADTTVSAEDMMDTRHFHTILIDIDTAGESGINFLREFWLQFKIDGTKVAVLSRDTRLRETCEDMGFPYFPKPIRMKDMEDVLGSLLHGKLRPAVTRPLPVLA